MEGFNCLFCAHSDKRRKQEIDGVHMIRCKRCHAYVNIASYCDDYDYDMKIYDIEGEDDEDMG